MWRYALVFYSVTMVIHISKQDSCPSKIKPSDRKDCHPMPATLSETRRKCSELGCQWCESTIRGVPWCFYDNSSIARAPSCPSNIPPESRENCDDWGNSSRDRCVNKGCVWCESTRPGTPWCFYNTTKTFRESCPAEISDSKRIDCMPSYLQLTTNKENCIKRGCFWCPSQTNGVPWCFLDSRNWPEDNFDDIQRINCHPDPPLGGKMEPMECIRRGCRWRTSTQNGVSYCFMPPEKGYKMVSSPVDTGRGYTFEIKRNSRMTLFGKSIDTLKVEVEYQSDRRVRVKFSDPSVQRFEVPLNITSSTRVSNPLYNIVFSDDPVFSFKVIRNDTGTVIFNSTGLVFEDQFLQIVIRLPSNKIYGFGMHQHKNYMHDLNFKTYGMWARDQPPIDGGNLYGVHPMYMGLENDGNAHGVLFLNANAQDVLLSPVPSVTYRTIGGILDLYIMLGPTPENVIQEYTAAVGRPFMPPYWSLGFSLAKYGYGSLDNMKNTIDRIRKYDIPHDYQFGDIDYMDRHLDFTFSKSTYAGLPDYVNVLKKEGIRFIPILDPAISTGEKNYKPFDLGNSMDVWVKDSDGKTPVLGKVWPDKPTYFPDFFKQSAKDWWIQLCKEFKGQINYDGLWIDMNEPANFVWGDTTGCENNEINTPPYFPKILGPVLSYKTLCPNHKHVIGNHYDVHSLYGWSQAEPTLRAAQEATGKRSIVLSRSTFPGAGKYVAGWLGDNWSYWSNMHYSIIGMFEFNMFGIPFIGADICGFIRDTTYDMCMRWMQLGAFYPFSRNHNLCYENRDQDPTSWDDNFAKMSRDVLLIRYTLLPYLYTLFHDAHTIGSTVVRPLFHEFVADSTTHNWDRQFLWGPAFLVSPVLDTQINNADKSADVVRAYFPDARWYSYYDGKEGPRKKFELLNAPWNFINLHVRGGYILPTQQPARNTNISRNNPLGLIVALDDNDRAEGKLFWDDGESQDTYENGKYCLLIFNATKTSVNVSVQHDGYSDMSKLRFGSVRVFGLKTTTVSELKIKGKSHASYSFDTKTKVLEITHMDVQANTDFKITWLADSNAGTGVIG